MKLLALSRYIYMTGVILGLVYGGLASCGTDSGEGRDAGPGSPPADTPKAIAKLTFESGPVRPLVLSADGTRLFVANTPNGSLDILQVTPAGLVSAGSVKVGV